MQPIYEWLFRQSLASWCCIALVGNAAAAGLSVLACWGVSTAFSHRRLLAQPQPLVVSDLVYSIAAVVLNSLVAVVGWLLWKNGWIELRHSSFQRGLFDTLLLLFLMDFLMYVFHRIAHLQPLYRLIHGTHHTHSSTNPFSLFVLNPFEVLGFGSLLIAVLMAYPFSAGALLVYLTLNLAFGTIGHLGVEPVPSVLMRFPGLRYFGTSTFHGQHHADKNHNFGFYTTIWDRLFGTLSLEYDDRVSRCVKQERNSSLLLP
jgi:lathosterol oxidase